MTSPKIHYSFDDVFLLCMQGKRKIALSMQDAALNRFLRASHKVFNVYARYQLYYLYPEITVGVARKEYLMSLYDNKLRKAESAGRDIYDKLRGLAPYGKCQICHYGEAATLDHYLPKNAYPSLSISPFNLIPACWDCNTEKHTFVPLVEHTQTIHPRYDRYYQAAWLSAVYVHHEKLIAFYPNAEKFKPNSRDYARIQSHLETHGVDKLYSSLALVELGTFIRLAQRRSLTVHEVVQIELDKLVPRYSSESNKQYTLDQWKIAMCKAILDEPLFSYDAGYLADLLRLWEAPNYDFT